MYHTLFPKQNIKTQDWGEGRRLIHVLHENKGVNSTQITWLRIGKEKDLGAVEGKR